MVKNLPANAGDIGDVGLIPGSGRSPGEGNGNSLQYSCLGNLMDRGAWCAAVHGVATSRTRLTAVAGAGIWVCCFFKTHSSKPVTPNSFRDTSHSCLVAPSQSLGFSSIESLLWVLEIPTGQSPPPQRVWIPILGCPFSSGLLILYNSNLSLLFPPG